MFPVLARSRLRPSCARSARMYRSSGMPLHLHLGWACAQRRKSAGGEVLNTKSRRVRSRVAIALRMSAQSLHHAKDYLGEFFRRITRKLGKPQVITATAHKLARIIFHLLSTREPYNEGVFHKCEEETLKRAELRLRKHARPTRISDCPSREHVIVPWESRCVHLL